ncbi:MAG: hypothetical protein J6I74_07210, partial [Schwartzia sp.]|nr:hypothetical protein [Schwartzia sp. (in: firmicutes)]
EPLPAEVLPFSDGGAFAVLFLYVSIKETTRHGPKGLIRRFPKGETGVNELDSASAREESELVAACFPPLFSVLRVGKEAARAIQEGGLSLEEYCAEG